VRPGTNVEELSKGDDPEELLVRSEHVAVVDHLRLLATLLAEVGHGLVDGHVRSQTSESRVHQAGRLILGIGEQPSDFLAGGVVEESQ
jgi:hypothetical protein